MYWQSTVIYSIAKIIHCTITGSSLEQECRAAARKSRDADRSYYFRFNVRQPSKFNQTKQIVMLCWRFPALYNIGSHLTFKYVTCYLPYPTFSRNFVVFSLEYRFMMLWSLHTENTRLISRGIIFDVLRPIWSRYFSHWHILSSLRHLRYQWPWISLRGHLRSLIYEPVESAYVISYWCSMVGNLVLSCRVSEILEELFVHRKPRFRYPSPIRVKISGCSLWSRSVMLGSAKSEHLRLTNRQIAKLFLRFPTYVPTIGLPQRHGQTDRQTDGQFAV